MTELNQDAINQVEDHIAYERNVELMKWIDTSHHGFKVTLKLYDRAELDYFDGVMTMRKNRGGQRYHTIVQPIRQPADPELMFQMESQFCGRGWSETGGAHIAIHISEPEAVAWWRQQKCADQVEKEHRGELMRITLMELDDDEMIINQAKRARQRGVVDPQPKGGPRSKAVAILMQDQDWIDWLVKRSIYKSWALPPDRKTMRGGHDLNTPAGREIMVKTVLQIESKIELDNGNEDAWQRWEHSFHRPFIQWMQRK